MKRFALFVSLLIAMQVAAAPPSPADIELFEKQIRPVLSEHCWSCHGPKKQTAGLRLDSRTGLLKGGESGPAIDEKEPAKSLLLSAIRHQGDIKMPPKLKLSPPAIDAIAEWLKRGAPWPEPAATDATDWRKHWAFQPIATPQAAEIDRFIVAKLKEKGLSPSAEADKRTLIRRVTFDLTGLPPTPEEVDTFLKDDSPDAHEKLVNRLLDSPAYGEHLGRMWLDVARYADTKGYVFFEENNYPWGFTLGDSVIQSYNKHLPFNQFVLEQLAADRLVGEDKRPLRAMGYLTVGGRFMNNTHDIIDDRIDVVTRGLMGLTVGCARCHDHKFDPIPTRDYYSLYGVFASSDEPTVQPLYEPPPKTEVYEKFAKGMVERETKLRDFVKRKRDELAAGQRKRAAEYLLAAHAIKDRPGQEDFMLLADGNDINPKMIVRWQAFLNQLRRSKNAVFVPWHRFADIPEAEFAKRAEATAADPVVAEMFNTPPKSMTDVANRYAMLLSAAQARMDASFLTGGVGNLDIDPDIAAILRDPSYPPNVRIGDYGDLDLLPDRPAQGELQKFRKDVETWRSTDAGAPPRAMVLHDAAEPMTPRIFNRGNPYNLGAAVPRQFIECIAPERKPFAEGSGRLELAKAIVDPKNPLTARVFVNRVWQHLFGRGIVTTPGDFGLRGDPPSHPELLDHLASTFVADGWSVKRLIKRVVLSSTYRQTSEYSVVSSQYSVDPDNSLFWRANRRRIGFEPMRDSLLVAAGKLNRKVGGPSVQNFLANNATRRTMYAHFDRLNVPGVYRTFDYPSPDATSAKRDQTTVPPQALFLMNHPFVAECAKNVTLRPDVAAIADQNKRLDRVFAILYGRQPTDRERSLANEILGSEPAKNWPRFAHALLMTNEFMFVD